MRAPLARTRAQCAAVRPERSGERSTAAAVGEQHLLLELVRLGGARARLEDGAAAEEQVLDRALGDRGEREHDRQALHAYQPPAALAGGIGAVRPRPPSRSRSIFPSVFASASPAASEGSESATVTGMLAEARSSPSGAVADRQHAQAAGDRARPRAGAALEGGEHRHPVARTKRAAERAQRGDDEREGGRPRARRRDRGACERRPLRHRRRELAPEHRLQLALGNERRHRPGVTGELGDAEIGADGARCRPAGRARRRAPASGASSRCRPTSSRQARPRRGEHRSAAAAARAGARPRGPPAVASSGLRRRTRTWPFSLGWRSTSLGRWERIWDQVLLPAMATARRSQSADSSLTVRLEGRAGKRIRAAASSGSDLNGRVARTPPLRRLVSPIRYVVRGPAKVTGPCEIGEGAGDRANVDDPAVGW